MTSNSLIPVIPDNVIAFIGDNIYYPYSLFAFWKGGHILVVQAPCITKRDDAYFEDNKDAQEEIDRDYRDSLELIHSLIDTIEFDKSNWAYLTKISGSYQLLQKFKRLPTLTTPLCAPFIEESEIKLKGFLCASVQLRIGEWKGQEVEVFRAWDACSFSELNVMFENYRALEKLDLTFKVIGNLVDTGGQIVGLVTEPQVGREIRANDRSVVYKAIAKLQEHGYLFSGVLDSMIISEGKVRLINMHNAHAFYYSPEERPELEETAKRYHWEYLRILFAEQIHTRWPEAREVIIPFKICPRIPSPERPLRIQIYLPILIMLPEQPRNRRNVKLKAVTTSKTDFKQNEHDVIGASKRSGLPRPLLSNTYCELTIYGK